MTTAYPNGAGETLGDAWATAKPLMMSGVIWWVDSVTGTDAVSPAGQDREKPLATLAQANTNAASGDLIVLKSTHSETLTGDVTISNEVTIVGAGALSGLPTATLMFGAGGRIVFSGGQRQELRNIYFKTRSASALIQRVLASSTDVLLDGCYFECGVNDGGAAVSSAFDRLRIDNCTFVSIATSSATRPESAVKMSGATAGLRMNGVVFDGGAYGFTNPYAFDASAAAQTVFEAKGISLLRGAEMKFHASSTGKLNVATTTGGGRVTW